MKDAQAAAAREATAAKEWGVGAKSTKKADAAAEKADEVARKRREKQALLEAEEAEMGKVKGPSRAPSAALAKGKKGGKKKKDDLSFLEDSLISGDW